MQSQILCRLNILPKEVPLNILSSFSDKTLDNEISFKNIVKIKEQQ